MDRNEIVTVIVRHFRENIDLHSDVEVDLTRSMLEQGATSLDLVEIVTGAMRELRIRVPRSELAKVGKVQRKQVRVAVVANRVRDYTLIWDELDEYLDSLKLPYVAAFREAQNYIRAYTRGLGIHELPEYLSWPDQSEWEPLVEWLGSRSSKPARAAA